MWSPQSLRTMQGRWRLALGLLVPTAVSCLTPGLMHHRAAFNGISVAMMAAPPPPPKAFYNRPSAALERGGGFYVPGLEGTKLRVVAATVLTAGLTLNRFLSPGEPASSQIVSEALGAFGCLLIFAQSASQAKLEKEIEADDLRAAFAARQSEVQELSSSLRADANQEARARWSAAALLRLTPARAVLWIGAGANEAADDVLIRYGRFPPGDAATAKGAGGAQLRAMLPVGVRSTSVELSDGVSEARPPAPLPSNAASVALCRCGDGVVALASERPAAFSPQHIQWLEAAARLLEL